MKADEKKADLTWGVCMRAGQAIAIDMPMTVESVVAYFGVVLAGCAAVSIADSFAPAEIAMRLRISNAAAVVTQDVIGRGAKKHPLYARVVEAKAPRAVVVPANAAAGLQVACPRARSHACMHLYRPAVFFGPRTWQAQDPVEAC